MPACRIGDNERCSRLPEFSFAIAMYDFRARVRRLTSFQYSISQASQWVSQRGIGEGKLVAGIDVVFVLLLPATWLTELIIRERLA